MLLRVVETRKLSFLCSEERLLTVMTRAWRAGRMAGAGEAWNSSGHDDRRGRLQH